MILLLKKKNKILIFLFSLFILLIFLQINNIFDNYIISNYENPQVDTENDLKGLKTSTTYNDVEINDLPGSPFNWSWASTQPWCTQGQGTQEEPYIIEHVNFSYSSGTGNCLSILNSRKYFIIRNCTFRYSGLGYSGLYLNNVTNGQIIKSEIYSNQNGITLDDSSDIVISENQVHNNIYGIGLVVSEYNDVTKNNVSKNDVIGIGIYAENNFISENIANDNILYGVHLGNGSYYNDVVNNIINGNGAHGIFIDAQWGGNNTFVNNILNGNTNGIYARNSDNNNITGNIITNNLNGTWISADSDYNLIYNNSISKNFGTNGIDVGSNNDWNNTLIGNYWDDYFGVDESPRDGIGDSSYSIIGPAGSRDYLPIYENPVHDGSTIHIDGNGINALNWSRTALVKWWFFGSGTYSKPYTIKNLIIDGRGIGSDSCILIENSDIYFKIENCIVSNSSRAGIELIKTNNGVMINNICFNHSNSGIRLENSHKNTVSESYINYNYYGVIFISSDNNTVSKTNLTSNTDKGIYLWNTTNSKVSQNRINNNGNGIYSWEGYNNTISGNIIYQNDGLGIRLDSSHDNAVSENTISYNSGGLYYKSSDNNTISKNKVSYNTDQGIFLRRSNNTRISHNNINNSVYGIFIEISYNNTVFGNIAYQNNYFGIWNYRSHNSSIIENTANENGDCGIYLGYSNYNNVSRNTANYNTLFGIRIDNSHYNLVSGNNASYNEDSGIFLLFSNNNGITDNSVNNNNVSGINLYQSNNNFIENNKETINYNGIYGVYLIYSNYNSIKNNTINYNEIGIYLEQSNYNYIIGNTLIGNKKAIVQKDCEGNIITDNIIEDGKTPFPLALILIIIFGSIAFVAIGFVSRAIIQKRKVSRPAERKKGEVIIKKKVREEKEKLKREQKEAKERLKQERQKMKIENKLRERMSFIESLIKENNLKKALKELTDIKNIARSHELIDFIKEAEQKIIDCKKLELDTINRIKQTIINLGMKFSRLQLIDISEKSGIKDETLIEDIIKEMINKKEIRGEYFVSSKALALEVAAPMITREKEKEFNVFLSYATLDRDYYEISRIVRRLELYPEISNVYFWEVDSGENIVTFMEQTLKKTNVFVLFCSENSIKSQAVEGEWQAAYQLRKEALMKIVPVYEKDEHIPYLLKPMLNVKFTKDDFDGFIQKLYEEILR